jgi:hypothetical protein
MPTHELHKLVGRAVINRPFQAGILNGRRAELLRQYQLEPDEVAALLAVQASNVTEFAAAVEQIVITREAMLRRQPPASEGKRHGQQGELGRPWSASSLPASS